MRTNSLFLAVASYFSILTNGMNARALAEDQPADALPAIIQHDTTGTKVEPVGKQASLTESRLAYELLLAEMASKHRYGLEQGQGVRRIAPPFPKARVIYCNPALPWEMKANPNVAVGIWFAWDGEKLRQRGMTIGAAYRLKDIIHYGIKINPHEIEGPKEFLERDLEGDWVIRSVVEEENFLKELENILQKEVDLPVRLAFAKRVREVYVAKGKYHFASVKRNENDAGTDKTGNVTNDPIEIYGRERSGLGGGASGELKDFLSWVESWINVSIIDEVSEPPAKEITWHSNQPRSTISGSQDSELVLKNITDQTGITFTKDLRVVRRLLIEPL
jgi:hypothetical protein